MKTISSISIFIRNILCEINTNNLNIKLFISIFIVSYINIY
jgi:hypothetical protein